MTTSSTNTPVAHSTTANFDAWINEIYTGLVTVCGLTQTADTGQMAVPSTAVYTATTNAQVGYYVFAFNDALQATSPVYIKLWFGTGNTATAPQMWITIGTSTNGAGTLGGTVMTQVSALNNAAITNPGVTNYVSRYCYNAAQGFCGMAFKLLAGGSTTQYGIGGFAIYRSVSGTGAPNGTAVNLITNAASLNGGSSGGAGVFQGLSYPLASTIGPASASGTWTNWGAIPFSTTQTQQGTVAQVFPIWQWAPTASVPPFGITNALAFCENSEINVGATTTMTMIGTTSLTYINVAGFYGGSNAPATVSSMGSSSSAGYGCLMLWQ